MDIRAFKAFTAAALAVTDELGLHREAVMVSLDETPEGEVRLRSENRIEILPPSGDPEAFLAALGTRLGALDLSRVRRSDP